MWGKGPRNCYNKDVEREYDIYITIQNPNLVDPIYDLRIDFLNSNTGTYNIKYFSYFP